MNSDTTIFDNLNAVTSYLTIANYNLLRKTQRRIFLTTGIFPLIHALINKLLNRESTKQVTDRLIEIMNWKSNEDHFFATSLGRCKNVVA